MTKYLVSCGCSFSSKFDSKITETFGELLSNKLDYTHINLSRIGASNYLIAKQIEYAVSLNPEFITINATTPLRFDYVFSSLDKKPTLKDFKYGKNYLRPHTESIGKISSMSYHHIKNNSNGTIQKEKLESIVEFLTKYTDYYVKQDQDRFLLLGAISKIVEKNIKFIVIDFADIFLETDFDKKHLLNLHWDKMRNEFPHPDGLHFNQDGHNYIFEEIIKI